MREVARTTSKPGRERRVLAERSLRCSLVRLRRQAVLVFQRAKETETDGAAMEEGAEGPGKRVSSASSWLTFFGHEWMRERVLLSVLSGRPLHVRKIRSRVSGEEHGLPGLQPYEASFLRLICKVTAGSELAIDATGTAFSLRPGVLRGVHSNADAAGRGSASASAASASPVTHSCHAGRGVAYFLEPLVLLSAFSRFRMHVLLKGVTDAHPLDPSVDLLRLEMLPLLQTLLKKAGGPLAEAALANPAELRVLTRGLPEAPFGLVSFRGPAVARGPIAPLQLAEPAAPKARVRGVAFAAGASPALARRAVAAARGVLNAVLPDVWIAVEVPLSARKKKTVFSAPVDAPLEDLALQQREAFNRSDSKALGLCLTAEGVDGFVRAAEASLLLATRAVSESAGKKAKDSAEAASEASRALGNSKIASLLQQEEEASGAAAAKEAVIEGEEDEAAALGVKAARHLLLQILLGSVVSPRFASLPLLFAALAEEHAPSTVSKSPSLCLESNKRSV